MGQTAETQERLEGVHRYSDKNSRQRIHIHKYKSHNCEIFPDSMNYAMGGRMKVYYDLRLTFLGLQAGRGTVYHVKRKPPLPTAGLMLSKDPINNHEVTRASKIKRRWK